jgi:integrase
MPMLTAASVIKLKPNPNRRREIPDAGCPSLKLCIFPSGAKSWIMRFRRPDGRTAKLTLGTVNIGGEIEVEPVIGGHLSLAAARRLAAEVHRQRALGHDPVADHLAAKQRRRTQAIEQAENSFAACARRYVEEYASRKTRKWKITARFLGLDPDGATIPKSLAERWSDKPVATVGGNDIHALVQEVKRRGVPGLRRRRDGPTEQQARSMFSTLSKFFAWLVAQRVIDTNPCAGVERPKPSPARERVLTDDEIRTLWSACADEGPFGDVVKVLLITGQRLQEVARMRREELSADGTVWTLPAARTKNRREHVLSLPPRAREIICGRSGDYLFSFDGNTPLGAWSTLKRRLDARMPGVAAWKFHDLRRTAVTGMARAGADLHVIERAINHASGSFGGIVGVYQKHRFADEVARALQAWERLLVSIVEPSAANVVPLRG